MVITTNKHFRTFKRECKKWVRVFGLTDWEIHYFHEPDPDNDRAWISRDLQNHTAGVFLGLNWDSVPPSDHELERAAFHEVCELLLSPLDDAAKCRYTTVPQINEARHEVIHVLENVLWHHGSTTDQ